MPHFDFDHPRPQLRRRGWRSLNGVWDFADDPKGSWTRPHQVRFDERITVPFAPETPQSGINRPGYRVACWYRRMLEHDELAGDEQLMLHFAAVDYRSTVWVDGHLVGQHEGGYTPFAVDVTSIAGTGAHELVVRAQDDPLDLAKPRGKQDWNSEPHNIWYPRTTGIWQEVWLERLPRVSLAALHWYGDLDNYEVRLDARIQGARAAGTRLSVQLTHGTRELVDDLVDCRGLRIERAFQLDGRGLDSLRDELTWAPDHPALIDATLQVLDGDGEVLDEVESYTALRTVAIRHGRFLLNGRPYPLRMVLDQGYWPESGLTAPNRTALTRDVELAKEMGFNGVRKHQKVEDPRYLAAADRHGLLVWAELPPAYVFNNDAIRRSVTEWIGAIERDRSHPCIVGWVPFNESTGALSLPAHGERRQYLKAVSLLTSALDQSRLVITNDGWEALGGDVIGVHDYDNDPATLARRYSSDHLGATLAGYAENGRLQTLDDPQRPVAHIGSEGPRALMLTEFGGIGFARHTPVERGPMEPDAPRDRINMPPAWGYSTVASADELSDKYTVLLAAVHSIESMTGFCYTQFADTYQEINGLLFEDRTPKVPLETIRLATLGSGNLSAVASDPEMPSGPHMPLAP